MNNLSDMTGMSRPVASELLAAAREALEMAERAIAPVASEDHLLLEELSEQLFALQAKGVSYTVIAELLHRCSINLEPWVIKDYLELMQSRRLTMCEALISNCVVKNDVTARATFVENGLREALAGNAGLFLEYQPQVDMRTGQVLGAEALLRWNFKGALISPGEFISIAESSGLIVPIGEWVLREACREAKRWHRLNLGGSAGIKMSVNLSPKQFSSQLPDVVHSVLCDTGFPTDSLVLEITESLLVGPASYPVLQQLRDSGVRLAVDDFGTGYSCLAELQKLPLETIKIDRAFIKDLCTDRRSAVMVEIIIDLARKLGMSTVAEGVETAAQAAALTNLGCNVCQGYYYSRPLLGGDFVQFALRCEAVPAELLTY